MKRIETTVKRVVIAAGEPIPQPYYEVLSCEYLGEGKFALILRVEA